MNIRNNAVYGIELISQDGLDPGIYLTFTGKEIKDLVKLAKERLSRTDRGLSCAVEGEVPTGREE